MTNSKILNWDYSFHDLVVNLTFLGAKMWKLFRFLKNLEEMDGRLVKTGTKLKTIHVKLTS